MHVAMRAHAYIFICLGSLHEILETEKERKQSTKSPPRNNSDFIIVIYHDFMSLVTNETTTFLFMSIFRDRPKLDCDSFIFALCHMK